MTDKKASTLDTVGNYDLLEQVGEGCMGVVYKARHWETQDIVAIKVMPPEVAANPVLLKRFAQEFRVTSQLDHPNIVRVMEFSGTAPRPFLVMEFVEGESLGEKLDRDGALPEERAIRIILQIAHGLHRAHRQGLIHRDVKPDNILVKPDDTAKLTDLGLAKDSDAGADLTRTGRGLGTPDFMAPEQFRNAKNASVKCDIYSLGATLYHMVTGKVPFNEPDPVKAMIRKLRNELPGPREVVHGISERTDWAIRRAMSGNPDNRPATCREFAEDLLGTTTRHAGDSDHGGSDEDMWYVVFTDKDGALHTAKGTSNALRQKLKDGELGEPNQVRASKTTSGPFEPLHTVVEFRDLVVEPAPAAPLPPQSMARLARPPAAAADTVSHKAHEPPTLAARPKPAAPPTMTLNKAQLPLPLPADSAEEAAPTGPAPASDTWQTVALVVGTAVTTLLLTLLVIRFLLPYFGK